MRTIAISGASGLVGTALSNLLVGQGVRVRPLVRPGKRADDGISWDPEGGHIDHAELEGLAALVHLAGDGVADGRWTAAKKARIRDSRVRGTALLASALAKLSSPPRVWVSCSAVGYYGDRGADEIDESAPAGNDFLASVAQDWEAAADPAEVIGVRVVHPRLGIVLAPHGGALQKMLLPFRLGVGGKIGTGLQGMSWVSLDDTARAIVHMIEQEALSGPVNVTAPFPVTNAEFTRALGRALHRPTMFGVPAQVARLAFGELADGALLSGVRALPGKLLASGFHFTHPELAPFLAASLA
ncbi:MAG: uncharacterized protein JWN04_5526 [Myxococcaceae bacterium]|nr:uncharacterized protein [Myxococcaceae bacterium]